MGVFDDIRPLRDGAKVLARLLPEVDPIRTAVIVGAAVVVAAAQVSSGVVTGVLIGRVSDGDPVEGGTVALVVALPFLLLLAEAARLTGNTVGQTLKRRVDTALRRRVLALSLDPPGIAHLEDKELLALQGSARNLSPFSFTPGDAATELTSGLAVRLQPVLAALVVAWYRPGLAVLALVVWAMAHVMFMKVTVRLVMGAALTMSSPEVVYLRDLVQGPAAAKEVRVFGLGGWLGGRFLSLTRERMALSLAQRTGDVRSYLRAGGVLAVGLAGGLAWIGVAATRSELDVTATAVCVFALLGVFAVPNLFPDVPVMFGTFSVGAIEAAERAQREKPFAAVTGHQPAPPVADGIRFRDVTFRYPGSGVAVVEQPRPVRPGRAAAGGGRAQRRRQDHAGEADVSALRPGRGSRRGRRCRPPHDRPGRLAATHRCPVPGLHPLAAPGRRQRRAAHGAPGRCGTGAGECGTLCSGAARRAGADLSRCCRRGGTRRCTPSARGGVDLSGGQWQRVALARGLHAVETGASMLVLDEPTANLDPEVELEFFESVPEPAPRPTTVRSRPSSSPTASPPSATPIASSCSRRVRSSRTAPTTSSSPPVAATASCSTPRPAPSRRRPMADVVRRRGSAAAAAPAASGCAPCWGWSRLVYRHDRRRTVRRPGARCSRSSPASSPWPDGRSSTPQGTDTGRRVSWPRSWPGSACSSRPP